MGEKYAKAIADMGYRVRIYCPFGELIPGMSYLIRRLLENTANSSFLGQSELAERNLEELIQEPPPVNDPPEYWSKNSLVSTMSPILITLLPSKP